MMEHTSSSLFPASTAAEPSAVPAVSNSAITYRSKRNPNVQITLEFSGTIERAAIEKAFTSVFLEQLQSELIADDKFFSGSQIPGRQISASQIPVDNPAADALPARGSGGRTYG